MNDLFERLLILRSPKVGPATYNDLLRRFGSPGTVVDFLNVSTDVRDSVMREMDMAQQLGVKFISDTEAHYPMALKQVKNHPPILSVRGNIAALGRESVAIVGTRHATSTGMNFVADMAMAFAAHGVAVVSGMAMGTDAAAHRGALRADGAANTVAVLAGGVDYIWPLENESLYYEIIERGVVISEMPVGFKPVGSNFVQRNRWIAGISEIMILGEADMKSGSMTTARFAIESGRKLWAIPSHPADSRAAGPNSLIADGSAKLCMGESDFFGDVKKVKKSDSKNQNSESENDVFDRLGTIPLSESVLAQIVKKSISEIKRDLVVLELRGVVKKVDGGYIRL